MNRLFIISFCISCFLGCASKKAVNRLKFDKKSQQEILYGFCNLKGLQSAPFNDWYDVEFQNYEPNYEIISNIDNSQVLADVNITVVMATWCSDSRREVPRFYKIVSKLDYNTELIKLINVDREKEAKGTSVSKLGIERVPTFIFYRGKAEIGRIIESPEESLEEDMFKILVGR